MDAHLRPHWSRILMYVAIAAACLMFCIAMLWLMLSEQKTKLYEADNVVCASQPFSMTCFERKPR